MTISPKSYILRNTCGFAQIAQKQLAQNSLRFMRKNSAKVRKKISHFVETLYTTWGSKDIEFRISEFLGKIQLL